MNFRGDYISTYFQERQHKLRQKIRRQKQIAVGAPAAMPLQPIPLDSKQKQAISEVRARVPQEKGSQIITPNRLSLFISLSLHLIMGLIATLYIVQVTQLDDDAVIAEIIKSKPPEPKRRVSPRKVKRIQRPKSTQIQPPQLRQVTTAVKIPTGDAGFTLPASDVSIPIRSALSNGSGIDAEGLERRLLTGRHRADIPSVIPKIEPNRSTSVIDKIEPLNIPPADFNADPVEPPTVKLNNVTQRPRRVHTVLPKYPDLARRAQKEGVVLLEASIGVDGIAKDISVVKGIGFGCDKAAIKALKASRFAPAKQGEQAVVVRIQIPYRFTLED